MKKLMILAGMILVLFAANANAADLVFDYPSDWDNVDGWTAVYNETGEVDTPYTKTIMKADVTQDGVEVVYSDAENRLNLAYSQEYDISLIAWNMAGAADPSNTIQYTRDGYAPPADSLPAGVVIEIPNAAVTIRVR